MCGIFSALFFWGGVHSQFVPIFPGRVGVVRATALPPPPSPRPEPHKYLARYIYRRLVGWKPTGTSNWVVTTRLPRRYGGLVNSFRGAVGVLSYLPIWGWIYLLTYLLGGYVRWLQTHHLLRRGEGGGCSRQGNTRRDVRSSTAALLSHCSSIPDNSRSMHSLKSTYYCTR